MNRRRSTSLAGSPLLIGAVTTLIVVVAVFLSYNANNGLPFVPTYNIKVALPEGSGLQPSNQVRIAGTRVGLVGSLTPHQDPTTGTGHGDRQPEAGKEGRTAAGRHEGDRAVGLGDRPEVPGTGKGHVEQDDQGRRTRSRSARRREPVDIDQLFNMFDEKTRTAIQINTNNFGDGLAGRGLGLNETIHDAAPAGRRTRSRCCTTSPRRRPTCAGSSKALDRAAEQTAPVAEQQRRRSSASRTRSSRPSRASRNRSKKRPRAVRRRSNRRSTRCRYEAPFTEKSTEFMRLLRPSAKALTTVAKPLGHAFAVGAVNLQRSDRAEHAPGRILAGAADVRAEPGRHGRSRRLHADAAIRQPGARRARARAGLSATT